MRVCVFQNQKQHNKTLENIHWLAKFGLSAQILNLLFLFAIFRFRFGCFWAARHDSSQPLLRQKMWYCHGYSISWSRSWNYHLPPFANYLFEEYGYQGTCFILSAVALNGLIAGAVIITPEAAIKLTWRPNTPTPNSDITKNGLKDKNANDELEIDINGNVLKAINSNTSDVPQNFQQTPTVAVTAYSNCAFTDSSVSLDTSTTEPDEENQTEEQIAANRAVSKKLNLKQLAKKLKYSCNLALFKDYKFVLYTLSLS